MASLHLTPRSPSPPSSPLHEPPPSGQAEAAETWVSSSLPAEEPNMSLTQSSPLPRASRNKSEIRPLEHPNDAPYPSFLTIPGSPELESSRPKRSDVPLFDNPSDPPPPSFLTITSSPEPKESRRPQLFDGSTWRTAHDDEGDFFFDTGTQRKISDEVKGLPSYISARNAEMPPNKRRRVGEPGSTPPQSSRPDFRLVSRSPSPQIPCQRDIPRQEADLSVTLPTNTQPPQPSANPVPVSVAPEPLLAQEQKNLVDLIASGKNVFYTGSAGCGKSTVLKAAVKRFRDMGQVVRIVAPTGRASLQVDGTTTWSFMGWTPDLFKSPLTDLINHSFKRKIRDRLRAVDLLIIDEISMVENHFFERMNTCMKEARYHKRKPETHGPFGGCQVIVTGDFCQLPPVKPFSNCIECGRETTPNKYHTGFDCPKGHGPYREHEKWAFFSDAWEECDFAHVGLSQIHRQSDPEFVRMLQKCRAGKMLTGDETRLLMDHPCQVDKATHLYPTVDEVRTVNARYFNDLPSKIVHYDCLDSFKKRDDHDGHERWKTRLPDRSLDCLKDHKMQSQVELKKDMLVVLQVNLDLGSGLCNGSQGIICGFEDHDPKKLPQAAKSAEEEEGSPGGTTADKKWTDPGFLDAFAEATTRSTETGDSSLLDSLLASRPTIRGENGVYREEQIQLFVRKQTHKPPVWPIVQFHNGQKRTIYPECVTSSVCFEPNTKNCLISRTQIPLMAGWAMSIHRSQGMTLDRVIVNLSRAFTEGQVYVALSRATSLAGLKVEGSPEGLAVGRGGNAEVREFLKEHKLLDDGFGEEPDEFP